jgi:hypothetical protein
MMRIVQLLQGSRNPGSAIVFDSGRRFRLAGISYGINGSRDSLLQQSMKLVGLTSVDSNGILHEMPKIGLQVAATHMPSMAGRDHHRTIITVVELGTIVKQKLMIEVSNVIVVHKVTPFACKGVRRIEGVLARVLLLEFRPLLFSPFRLVIVSRVNVEWKVKIFLWHVRVNDHCAKRPFLSSSLVFFHSSRGSISTLIIKASWVFCFDGFNSTILVNVFFQNNATHK